MNKFYLFIFMMFSVVMLINSQQIPDKSDKAYQTIVDTGAKLLGYDIERENINAEQKKLATDAGKTMGALEQVAKRFDDVVAATIALEKNFQNSTDQNKNETAIVALIKLLSHPTDLFTTTDNPEYRPAKDHATTATYIKEIQRIAQQQFPEIALKLNQNAAAFFDILRQTIINNFSDLLKNHPEIKATPSNDQSYQTLIDTGTKLLGLDIAREKISNAQKQFVKDTEKQSITSSDGKKISVMGLIEQINQRFDGIVIALVVLENSIKKSQTDNSNALTALVQILSHPEDQASFNTKPEYKAAMDNQSTANFIRKIQNFANASGKESSAKINLFYNIVRQAFINKFGSLVQVKEEAKPTQPTDTKTEPSASPQEMLRKAIMDNSAEAVEKAIAAGADVNKEIQNKKPLHIAVVLNKLNAITGLLANNAKISCDILQRASLANLDLLLAKKANIDNACDVTSLVIKSMKYGAFKTAIELLKKGTLWDADSIVRGYFDSHYSTDQFVEVVTELVKRGYDINKIWIEDLKRRSEEIMSSPSILKGLLKAGVDPNYKIILDGSISWSPLFMALDNIFPDAVKILLDAGANINQQESPNSTNITKRGQMTPLAFFEARIEGHGNCQACTDLMEYLISKGAIW